MRYRVTFRGSWQGPLLHAFADVDPTWDPDRRATVVSVTDQSSLVSLVNRATEFGIEIIDVESLEEAP